LLELLGIAALRITFDVTSAIDTVPTAIVFGPYTLHSTKFHSPYLARCGT
jgi:hypothetical protein